ncbi:MAG: Sec-independent protein translocase protein TatB [Pseudomonadota bacterium]
MFDVGFSELLLLAIIALVVLGPEKLPHAARMAGAWVGRIRRMIISVQADIENEVAAAEMRERIKKEMEKVKAASGLDDAQQALTSALDDSPRSKPDSAEKP